LDGSIKIHCQFFIAGQLELDISPKEITCPLEHGEVLSFVETLADALELSAAIAPENAEKTPFLTYMPQSSAWHIHDNPK
jgi:hypothetical protein